MTASTGDKTVSTWNEYAIARAIALQAFERKHLVMVPNCNWTGNECDLLVVTRDLRIIDVEVKISRADFRADAKKDKWWHRLSWSCEGPKQRRLWPSMVWKHYFAMPAEIWTPELAAHLPSTACGVILLRKGRGRGTEPPVLCSLERRAKPNKDAERVTPEQAIDLGRLASLRMWDAFEARDDAVAEARRLREGVAA